MQFLVDYTNLLLLKQASFNMTKSVRVIADVDNLQKLMKFNNGILEVKPLVAFVMRKCECTYDEIGKTIGVSKQRAQVIVKEFEAKL